MGEVMQIENVLHEDIVAKLVLDGDLSSLTPQQRVVYYVHRCNLLGIDPGEKPFELLKLDGKLMLYAGKACANALTRLNRLSVAVVSTQIDGDLVTVIARAQDQSGRFTDDAAVIDLSDVSVVGGQNKWGKPVSGIGRPNAIMKAVTKAKRRAVLSLVGLGVLDDSEIDSVRGAQRVAMNLSTGDIDAPQALECDADRADVLRALDSAVGAYAQILGTSKQAVFAKAAAHMRVTATVPADLDTDAARTCERVVMERIRSTCTAVYKGLCELDPDSYSADSWQAEWSIMARLDTWPERPSPEEYATIHARMSEITLATIDGLDPTDGGAP